VHASVYRFVPTAFVGACWPRSSLRTRSVVPAILLHLGYNAILVLGDPLPVARRAAPGRGRHRRAVPCCSSGPRPNATSR
jgi:hypothetical protein